MNAAAGFLRYYLLQTLVLFKLVYILDFRNLDFFVVGFN